MSQDVLGRGHGIAMHDEPLANDLGEQAHGDDDQIQRAGDSRVDLRRRFDAAACHIVSNHCRREIRLRKMTPDPHFLNSTSLVIPFTTGRRRVTCHR